MLARCVSCGACRAEPESCFTVRSALRSSRLVALAALVKAGNKKKFTCSSGAAAYHVNVRHVRLLDAFRALFFPLGLSSAQAFVTVDK